MQCCNTKDSYGRMSITLHWVIALLVPHRGYFSA
jgi:cytochrome b561